MTEFDYIIVGGGAAGCVLANRLSSNASLRVLVCEAGRDVRDGQVPEQILDSFAAHAFLDSRFLWNDLQVTTASDARRGTDAPPAKLRKYEQARVLGGGSSINGQLANRGAPHDYDEWERRGAAGWRWETVLPYFRKLERDVDFEGPLHGSSGPMPIRRIFPDLWADHAKAMAEGFRSLGYEYLADQNGEFRDGYFPFAINNLYDRRVPVCIAYLGPAVRQRPNLAIETETHVNRGVRRDLHAGPVAAFRYRAGRGAASARYSGSTRSSRCRQAVDGSSLGCHRRFREASCAAEWPDAAAPARRAAVLLRASGCAARRHGGVGFDESRLARGRRADRFGDDLGQQDVLRRG
jgi:choline dehydrogenase-like flavoprotein